MKAQDSGKGLAKVWIWKASAYQQEMSWHGQDLGEPSVLRGECLDVASRARDGTLLKAVIASMLKCLEALHDDEAVAPQEKLAQANAMTVVIQVGRRPPRPETIPVMRYDVIFKGRLAYTSVLRADAPRTDIEPIQFGCDAGMWSVVREILLRL